MRSFQTERQFSLRKLLYKCAIFIAAVGVIVYFMPRTGTFNYQFDINKPWKYGLLQASFDFPIYKSDSEVKHEQDSIMKHYHPYFKLMEKKGEEAIKSFREDYNRSLRAIIPDPGYKFYIERKLKSIYDRGIMGAENTSYIEKENISSIQIVKNNISILQSTSEIFSTKQAYIGIDNYQFIQRFLSVVAPKVSMSKYIDDVLTAHIEQYQEEIDSLYHNQINNKPLYKK